MLACTAAPKREATTKTVWPMSTPCLTVAVLNSALNLTFASAQNFYFSRTAWTSVYLLECLDMNSGDEKFRSKARENPRLKTFKME